MGSHGYTASSFEHVRDTFDTILTGQPAGGAAFSVFVEGECVIDLHGGESRPGDPWAADTLSLMFSNTKGLVSILVATLVESGALDPDAPLVEYWPMNVFVPLYGSIFEMRQAVYEPENSVRSAVTLRDVGR